MRQVTIFTNRREDDVLILLEAGHFTSMVLNAAAHLRAVAATEPVIKDCGDDPLGLLPQEPTLQKLETLGGNSSLHRILEEIDFVFSVVKRTAEKACEPFRMMTLEKAVFITTALREIQGWLEQLEDISGFDVEERNICAFNNAFEDLFKASEARNHDAFIARQVAQL